MRKLGLIALAASAAVDPVSAQTVPDPNAYDGMPDLRLSLPSGAAAAAAPAAPAPAPRAPRPA